MADGSSSSAIYALVGALGGVSITGVMTLTSNLLNRKWTMADKKRDRDETVADRRYQEKREVYVNLLMQGDKLSTICINIRAFKNKDGDKPSPAFAQAARDLVSVRHDFEMARAQASILAGDNLREIINQYDQALIVKMRHSAKGETYIKDSEKYDLLVEAIRDELNR